jgi:hypothetical protein
MSNITSSTYAHGIWLDFDCIRIGCTSTHIWITFFVSFLSIKCIHIPVQKIYTTHANSCNYLQIQCLKAGSINKLSHTLSVALYLYV